MEQVYGFPATPVVGSSFPNPNNFISPTTVRVELAVACIGQRMTTSGMG